MKGKALKGKTTKMARRVNKRLTISLLREAFAKGKSHEKQFNEILPVPGLRLVKSEV